MSDVFGPACRPQGALPLSIGVGDVVPPEGSMSGLHFDDSGRVYSVLNSQIDHWAHGLPFNLHGRLCVNGGGAVTRTDQGVPYSGTDHVCIGAGPVTYWDQGTPFNAAGQVVYVETPNP